MISWAFIFEAPDTDPATDRMVIERGGLKTTIVAVPEQSDVTALARALVDDGVQFIELCGGFEPIWAGKVIEATYGRIPVGSVGYGGGGSMAKMAAIFAADGDAPDTTREGDIHIGGDMKVAWFKDPDGNILNLTSR